MISVKESASFKYPDHKTEMVTHAMLMVVSSALCPILVKALLSQILTEWAKLLPQGLDIEQVYLVYVELAD